MSENLPLIGLVVAALVFFFPQKDREDAFQKASDEYREGIAGTLVEMKDDDKTEATATKMTKRLAAERVNAFGKVKNELLGLWWEGSANEAAARLRERRTTGVRDNSDD